MSFLARLFGRPDLVDRDPSHAGKKASLPGPGTFEIPIVGESHYQNVFEEICGPRSEEGEDRIVEAQLVLEDDNPYDSKAVRVDIEGRPVGYLGRDGAREYRARLAAAGYPTINAWCQARIRGGWDRGPDDRGCYGAYLDLPTTE